MTFATLITSLCILYLQPSYTVSLIKLPSPMTVAFSRLRDCTHRPLFLCAPTSAFFQKLVHLFRLQLVVSTWSTDFYVNSFYAPVTYSYGSTVSKNVYFPSTASKPTSAGSIKSVYPTHMTTSPSSNRRPMFLSTDVRGH